MKSFLKYTLATITGIIITSVIFFIVIAGIVGSILVSANKEETIKPKSILLMKLNYEIPDRSSESLLDDISFGSFKSTTRLGLNDILKCIHNAKYDSNVKGIYMNLSSIDAGWSTTEEIRNALLDFRKSKKFVVAYSDMYTQKAYYLASAADSVFLNPQGDLLFVGLRSEIMFFKGTLDKLEIEPEIFRHGKFKSYVEPYTTDKMSEPNREQLTSLLSGVWKHVVNDIAQTRKLTPAEVNNVAEKLLIRNPKAALESKFIDGLKYKDEMIASLVKLSGVKDEKKLQLVSLNKYIKVPQSVTQSDNKIAIVYACGEINMGEGDDKSIGSDNLSRAIREARQDSSIKAIVLRINSPGGSALAAEVIWREVQLATKVKPVVVSMGSVAASGGYYIAAPGHTVIADNTTITGSIGVFGMLFNAKNFMNKKLGITTDVAKTNAFADAGSVYRPVTPEEREVLQNRVENIYDVFLERVADGRRMKKENVDSVAQGRVWCAADAQKLGLIDSIGDLSKAIEIAAAKAKLKAYQKIELPKQEDALTTLLNEFMTRMKTNTLKEELGDELIIYNKIKEMKGLQGIQARLPYDFYIY